MKVSVLGAGAIGSMLGGLIKHRDPAVEVVLVARGEHGQRMRERGAVVLHGPWGTCAAPVDVTEDVSAIAGSDLVLLTVKSQATDEALQSAAPYLGEAVVVSIQNGINRHTIARHVPLERLAIGMTATNMAVLTPGEVSLQLDGPTILGGPPGHERGAAVERAVEILRRGGLRIERHDNVAGVQYNKLAINALGCASVLSASNFITECVLDRPWRHAVGNPVLDECIAAFTAAGIRLEPIPGVPDADRFRRVLKLLDLPLAGRIAGFVARRKFDRKPIVFSILQDLRRRKTTEIDFINGEVVRLARERGGDAPANALVVAMVRELERRGDGTFFAREEAIERFAALAKT